MILQCPKCASTFNKSDKGAGWVSVVAPHGHNTTRYRWCCTDCTTAFIAAEAKSEYDLMMEEIDRLADIAQRMGGELSKQVDPQRTSQFRTKLEQINNRLSGWVERFEQE